MFTLPVSTDELIWSKLFVASIWTVLSCIVVMLAITIMAVTGESFRRMLDMFSEFFRSLSAGGANAILCTSRR